MSSFRRRPDLATILSILALFVALGGSAYAAARITGQSVKNNSLSGKDVRDRSLRAKDLRPGAIPAGRPGPAGPAGPQGPPGEPGVSRGIQRFGPRTELTGPRIEIVEVRLPAGSWVLSGAGLANNSQSADVARAAECTLQAGGSTLAGTGLMSLTPDLAGRARANSEHFAITGVATLAAATDARLVCDRAGGSGVFVEDATLTAVEVGSINTEAGD